MGPAEHEEGGSLRVHCQPNVSLFVVLRGCAAACVPERPAVAGCHASKRAVLAVGRESDDVPAEVSELLVDALESHGGVCMWCCGGVRR
jgi:hypothetical protein